MEKIEKSLRIWSSKKLNLLERMVVIRTFALSLLWYIANFIVIEQENIKKLKSVIFEFLWEGKRDLISRGTMILPYEKGGLNVVCIEAKLKCILMRYFSDLINKNEEIEYRFGVYWLKFHIPNKKIENFNIIASGLETEAPRFFKKIIEIIKEYKKLVSNNKQKTDAINITKSKEFYEIFRKSNEISPKIESQVRNEEWEITYKSQHKNICSELRSMNFKILYSALYTKDKFKKNKDKLCLLCKKKEESTSHIYIECEYTNDVFGEFCRINNIGRKNNLNDIIFMRDISKEEREKISIFKLVVWKMRIRALKDQGHGKEVFFGYYKTLYNKLACGKQD